MDEEGTVVYFKTSPAVQDLEGGDSLQEQVFTDHLDSPAGRKKRKNTRDTSRTRKGVPWKQAFSPPNWFGNRCQELRQAQQVVEKIKESPLLTEEDYQLLHITTAVQKCPNVSLSSANFSTLKLNTSRLTRLRYQLISCLVTVLLAWGVTVSGGRWIAAAALVILVICGCVAMATKQMYRRSVKKMQKAVSDLSTYNSKFESLLALLTQTIRLIQETEIVSRGYSRPSRNVPITRVERQGGAVGYQCMTLRRRVFETCQQGVVLLRRATVSLCKDYPLSEELDNAHTYLAFVPLEDLHPHFQEETNYTEARPTAEHVSLESLKDAGSLLAVQNSEMLRRLALNLTPVHVNTPKVKKFHLVEMSQILQELIYFVSEALEKLTWSFEFHKNYLFGDPPVRSTVLEQQEVKAHPLLQALAEEVHCVDLKTQVALQRIRELGLLLAKLQMSEDSGSVQDADMQTIRAEMLSIQQGLECVTEHLTDGTQLIDQLQQPDTNSHNQVVSSGVTTMVGVDDAGPEDQQQHREEESSDEEMVFEAYVCAESSERENSQGLSEDKLEAKEAPIKMVKELRSVLAIRSLEKQRRREEKQKRKLLKELSTPGEDHVPSEVNSSLRGLSSHPSPKSEFAVEDKPCSHFNMKGKDQFEKHPEDNTDCKPVVQSGMSTLQKEVEPPDTTTDEAEAAVPNLRTKKQTCSQASDNDQDRRTDILLGSGCSSSRYGHSRFDQQLLDNQAMAKAAAAVAMVSGQGSEDIFQDSSEDECQSN